MSRKGREHGSGRSSKGSRRPRKGNGKVKEPQWKGNERQWKGNERQREVKGNTVGGPTRPTLSFVPGYSRLPSPFPPMIS